MAFAIRQLSERSIAIITVDVPLACYPDSLRAVMAQTCALAYQFQELACIIDLNGLDLSYSDILLCLDEYRQLLAAHPEKHAHIMPIVVGNHPIIALGIKKIEQQLGISIARYDTLELACAAVRPA